MSTLLAPNVIGPVSVLSTAVRVDGPLPTSDVHLLVNGTSKQNITASSTTTYIPLSGVALNGGDKLTARWIMGGDASDPSPIPVTVMGLPVTATGEPALDPLVFLSQVHDCVDWILLGGAFPGAQVEIFNGATQIGIAIAESDVVAVRITGTINTNNTLEAVQSVPTPSGTVKSNPTPSLPSEPMPYREDAMSPLNIGPIPSCAQAVLISGIWQGATTRLVAGGSAVSYRFIAPSVWALLGREAFPPETFTATQHFERCNAFSPSSAPPVPVDKAQPLKKPAIDQLDIPCAAAKAIKVSNLETGAVLTFQIVSASSTNIIGRIGVGQGVSSTQFWLPDLSSQIPSAAPYPALVAVQEQCGQKAQSDPTYFTYYQTHSFPPFIIEPLVECAHYVQINSPVDAVIRLYSDAVDSPVISNPTYFSGPGWIKTYRGLRAGETVTAKLEATCQPPGLRQSPAVTVQALQHLNPPTIIEPVRIFHTSVFVTDIVAGAQIHIFVNGKWRATQSATGLYAGMLGIYIGTLSREDRITAIQTLCNKISSPTEPPAQVKPGEMHVWAEPSSVVQGQPVQVTIKAADADNNLPIAGAVSYSGSVIGLTNKMLTISPPAGQTSLTFTVSATGYSSASATVTLTAPALPKPAMLTIITALGFQASKKAIKEVTWKLLGPSTSYTKTEKPNSDPAAVQFALPNPSGGSFTSYTMSCSVIFEFENFNFISGVSGTRDSTWIEGGLIKPSPGTVELHWYGTDNTVNLGVEWRQSADVFVVQVY